LTAGASGQATSPPDPPPAKAPVVRPTESAPKPPVPSPDTAKSAPAQKLTCKWSEDTQPSGAAGLIYDSKTGQRKSWQPAGGELTFAVRSFGTFGPNLHPIVCFRWRSEAGNEESVPAEINRTELSSDSKTLTITVTIPDLKAAKNPHVLFLGIVPVADVLIRIPAASVANVGTPGPTDVHTTIGITNPLICLIITIAIGAIAFAALVFVVRKVLNIPKTQADSFLTVISTSDNYASLSQFQIVLWTFVVGLSAIYVMALSGELIQITTGTLVLLGISGATTVGSAINSSNQATTPPPANPPPLPPHPKPLLADLVTNSTLVGTAPNQTWKSEIDVTRFQMLLFTLVTAGFVILQVLTTYVIPDIPTGFQILMGISNGVYMGKKIVT
jgi:hypothetical protein